MASFSLRNTSNRNIFFFSEPDEALKVLGELKDLARAVYISLNEMLTLMNQCQQLDAITSSTGGITDSSTNQSKSPVANRGLLSNNPLTLFSGIIPGIPY